MPVGDLRTRLRWERVGVSRPEDLSHLACEGQVSEIDGEERGREGNVYFSAEVVCRGSGMSTAHACTLYWASGDARGSGGHAHLCGRFLMSLRRPRQR